MTASISVAILAQGGWSCYCFDHRLRSAMAEFDIQRKLCVNGWVVPGPSKVLATMDPFGLAESDKECMRATLVKFPASGPTSLRTWLHKILHLPTSTWWSQNCSRIPLLLEVLDLIDSKKPKGNTHALRHPEAIMPMEVRGKVLWFMKNSRCVTLALLEGHEKEPEEEPAITDLQWFLKELRKDTELLLRAPVEAERPVGQELVPPPRGRPKTSTPRDCEEIVDECLLRLRSHPQCRNAGYFDSRHCLWVARKGHKGRREFRVHELKRKRAASADHDHAGPVHDAFDKAMSLALSFLGPEAPDTLGDGDAQPLSGLGAPAPLCNAEAEEDELGGGARGGT